MMDSDDDILDDEEEKPKGRQRRASVAERAFLRPLMWGLSVLITGMAFGAVVVLGVFYHFSRELPDSSKLANYQPAGMTRLYDVHGTLMAEYAKERRVFVPYQDIPTKVIHAFIAAEDQDFYNHPGIDPVGIGRALLQNLQSMSKGERSLVGGSTITQQVVKNFLLSSEKSYERKIKEAILALRISQNYSKERILELYLNEIYLGMGAYGVAAAAQEYFGKELHELATEEIALLAGMPKAPSYYDPHRRAKKALNRRNYVLKRMAEDGYINEAEYERALASPLRVRSNDVTTRIKAPFFAEEVRRWLLKTYGEEKLYKGNLYVKTSADVDVQSLLDNALRDALVMYDRRHGYRGAITQLDTEGDSWEQKLEKLEKGIELRQGQRLAVVLELRNKEAVIGVVSEEETATETAPVEQPENEAGTDAAADSPAETDETAELEVVSEEAPPLTHEKGIIALADMTWARPVRPSGAIGAAPSKPADILAVGDVILVDSKSEDGSAYALAQIPEVSGAMVAMRPQTGEIIAMSGGYSFKGSQFNRATQAKRQPGSSFKPFVYLAALERGFTPSSLIHDAPIEISQGAGKPAWRPKNYGGDFLGLTTLRTGLEKSRNVMTVRLAQIIGINAVIHVAERLGIYDSLPKEYSSVLGSHETTVTRIAAAYSMIANGGLKVTPTLVRRVDDAKGKTIYRTDQRECPRCNTSYGGANFNRKQPPEIVDERERVIDPRIAYQMVSLLQGVVQRGTATAANKLGFEVAGKTGTTNESRDAWFVGFSQDLVVATYIGFDKPQGLGAKETGGRVALPAFIDFMQAHYKDAPPPNFVKPHGILQVAVDKYSGQPPLPWQAGDGRSLITETFVTGGSIFIPGAEITPQEDAIIVAPEATAQSAGESANSYQPKTYIDAYGVERYVSPHTPQDYTPSQPAYVPYTSSPYQQPQQPAGRVREGYTPIPPATPNVAPSRPISQPSDDYHHLLPPNHPSRVQERRQRGYYETRPRPTPAPQRSGAGSGTGGLY